MVNDFQTALVSVVAPHVGITCTAVAVHVESPQGVVMQYACGKQDPESSTDTVSITTPFDIASLTKLFTTSAILRLVAARKLDLDAPVRDHLPDFAGPGKERVSPRHLLTHTSGLPALVHLFGDAAPPGSPREIILSVPLGAPPGTRVEYSDVGFMILGMLIESITHQPLSAAMHNLVLAPLGLSRTGFGPCPQAPATEFDPWRSRRIRGEVHDENAAVLGGVSGHAGLFASASDVSRLARSYLEPALGFLPGELALRARHSFPVPGSGERRGLGWKLRSPDPEAHEAALSEEAFGHTGFTGTAVWTDPLRQITAVLLTNRVYFGRDATRITQLRREFFSTVATYT